MGDLRHHDATKIRSMLKRMEGYSKIESENLFNLQLHFECAQLKNTKTAKVILLFFEDVLIIIEKQNGTHICDKLDYKNIKDCKIYDEKNEVFLKLVIGHNGPNMVFSLTKKKIADRVAMLIYNHKDSMSKVTYDTPTSVISFGKLNFVINLEKQLSLENFKRKAISRLAQYFLPQPLKEDKVDVSQYSDYEFKLIYPGFHVNLDSDLDLSAALSHFKGKLNVGIILKQSLRSFKTQ